MHNALSSWVMLFKIIEERAILRSSSKTEWMHQNCYAVCTFPNVLLFFFNACCFNYLLTSISYRCRPFYRISVAHSSSRPHARQSSSGKWQMIVYKIWAVYTGWAKIMYTVIILYTIIYCIPTFGPPCMNCAIGVPNNIERRTVMCDKLNSFSFTGNIYSHRKLNTKFCEPSYVMMSSKTNPLGYALFLLQEYLFSKAEMLGKI